MNRSLLRILLCAVCVSMVLLMGSNPISRKISVSSWDARPDPTIRGISIEPNSLMMGSPEKMHLEVSGPEDLDTETRTDLSDDCQKTIQLVLDNIQASYWLITYNPGESFTIANLEPYVSPIAWNWRDGGGDYGSYTEMGGVFTVWDGRVNEDPRRDSKGFGAVPATKKCIPDKLETEIRLDHPQDLNGTGCAYYGTFHGGAYFYHPVQNQTFPRSFTGLKAKEFIYHWDTDAVHDPTNMRDPVVTAAVNIMANANGESTVDLQNRLNDNHIATGPNMQTIWDNGGTYLTLLQEWHITTGGWNSRNADHAIQKKKGIGWHSNIIRYVKIDDEFIRCIKDGVTCLCQDPIPD